MQESGAMSPTGEGPVRSPAGSQANQNSIPSGEPQPSGTTSAPPQRTSDPVIRGMTFAIIIIIIIWLVGVVSAIMFGLLTPPNAPRTSAERDLMALGPTVESGKANTQTYAQYVGVLISAGQLSKAEQALDQALKQAKTDKSYLYAQQAQLYLAQEDYKGTVTVADKAVAEAQKELKAFMDKNVAENRSAKAGAKMPGSFLIAALAKAEALMLAKDYGAAITAFDVYLKQQPVDSDILVQRAIAKVKVGDKKGAGADYRAALKYIPDYQPALDGLKQIGAAR